MWDTESLMDNLGSDSEEKDSYEKFERDRKFMGSQKINMTAMKYFQTAAMQIETFSGEPLQSLSNFHEQFAHLE